MEGREGLDSGAAKASWSAILAGGGWAVLLLICGGVWLHAADSLVVATAMPSVVRELGGIEWTGWSFALYEVGSIVAGSLGGLAAARHGVGAALAAGAAVFAAGCLMSALAPSIGWFLAGRGVQGLGGGAMVALCHVAVTRAFPERHWTRLYAVISAVWGASALAGPLIGGLFSEAGLWRGAFLAFAVQAVLVVLVAPFLLRRQRGGSASQRGRPEPVPWTSLAVLSAGVLAVGFAGVLEAPWLAAGIGLLGLLLLLAFLRVDALGRVSLLPQRSLTRGRVRAGFLLVLSLSMASIAFLIYGPLLIARLHGLGPLAIGYLVSVESVAWSLCALAVAGVGPAGEGRWIRLGSLMTLVGLLGFALTVPQGPIWGMAVSAFFAGGGFGLFWSFLVRRVVVAAAPGDQERAAGALPTLQMLGYALGAAMAGILANSLGFTEAAPLATVERVAFWIFLAFLPLSLVGIAAARRVAR